MAYMPKSAVPVSDSPTPRMQRLVGIAPWGPVSVSPQELPELLSAPGGVFPGPAGWAMSAGGGGIGEAMRQPLMGEPLDPGRVGRVAATQGTLGMAGSALSKPLSWIGQRTLATAVGATPKAKMQIAGALGRAKGRTVGPVEGSIGKVMARERVGVREKDWLRLRDEVSALTKKADDIAAKAGQEGFRFTIDDFKGPLDKMRKELRGEWDSMPELKQFDAIVDRMDKRFKDKVLTPKQSLVLRRRWDQTARKVYERSQIAGGGSERGTMRAETAAAAATGVRQALGGMYPHGRELGTVLQRQSELIPLRDAILKALLANSGASPPFLPPVVSQMAMPQVLRSRTLLSALGLGFTDPMTMAGLRSTPRAAAEELGLPEGIEQWFNAAQMPPDTLRNE